ncbi:unnamed protein product [Phytophthora fragariaefolia]|uniref:Unnamed protein product n=1 Tax=Phytophthora fragariaefolia TaxID=1490495 RepID=A0A9W6Y4D7_9STRA|nr:unnamed protein product [Phytophthora fragariaefolia]
MMRTRPDSVNCVRQVSRYLHNPGPHHWNYVVRGFKYLNGTRDYGSTFGARDVTNATLAHALGAYSDADYANNVDSRRSVSGYVTYLFGSSPISWRRIFSLWLLPSDQKELPSSPRRYWESSKAPHHIIFRDQNRF